MVWWIALQGLDSSVAIPDSILAEQLLANAQITNDQKLMVRTMLQGDMSFDAVAGELIAQHPRVHESEKHRGGKGFGFNRNWLRSHGHHQRHRAFKSYLAHEEADEWESQDLSGFDEFDDENTAFYQDYETIVEEDGDSYLD